MTSETLGIIYGVVAVLTCIVMTTVIMINYPQDDDDVPEVVYGAMAGIFWPMIVAVALVAAPFFAIHYLCRTLAKGWAR